MNKLHAHNTNENAIFQSSSSVQQKQINNNHIRREIMDGSNQGNWVNVCIVSVPLTIATADDAPIRNGCFTMLIIFIHVTQEFTVTSLSLLRENSLLLLCAADKTRATMPPKIANIRDVKQYEHSLIHSLSLLKSHKNSPLHSANVATLCMDPERTGTIVSTAVFHCCTLCNS